METTKEKVNKYINGANITRIIRVKIRAERERGRERGNEKDKHYNPIIVDIV